MSARVVELPKMTKTIPCAGCGIEITVGRNTVFIYCRECSQKMSGKKQ